MQPNATAKAKAQLVARPLLDAARRELAREARDELGLLPPEPRALAVESIELHVQAQQGDVQRHHSRKQGRDHADPECAAPHERSGADGGA
jgi:hypothetical protein